MGDSEVYPEDSLSWAGCLDHLPQAKEPVRPQKQGRGRPPKVGVAEGTQGWGSESRTEVREEKKGDSVERGGRGDLEAETFRVEEFLMTVFERIQASASIVEHHGRRRDQN